MLWESTLNQILAEMDGFSTAEHVVLTGTSWPDVFLPPSLVYHL